MDGTLRPRVLVAEDDEQLNRLVVTWLKRADLDVDSVYDGANAIDAIRKNSYAVILLDVMMPRVTGLDVIEFVRQHQPRLLNSIIVMTAGGESITERIQGHPIYRLMRKPFDLRDLLDSALHCAMSGSQKGTTARRRMLVVDDDDATRYLMARPFVDDFEVDVATTGAQAIEQLRACDYDVVLLDLRMPEVDGVEVIAYLEENLPHVLEKVVLVTLAPEEVQGLPVAGVLPKSDDPAQIVSFISNRVLGKPTDPM